MKRFNRTLLLLVVLLVNTSIYAYEFEVDGIYYYGYGETGAYVTYGDTKYKGNIRIPEFVRISALTRPIVLGIGPSAFEDCFDLTNVTLPTYNGNGITIGSKAFKGCSKLTLIDIPSTSFSGKIYDNAFEGCDFVSVSIPENYTVYDMAFKDCFRLELAYIHGVLTDRYSRGGVFKDCKKLNSIHIGRDAIVYGWHFDGCESLRDISFDYGHPKYSLSDDGVLFNKDFTELVYCPAGLDMRWYTIPNSVTKIGKGAFITSKLTSVSIPVNVKFIEDYAFKNCAQLIAISIPNSVKAIGNYIFEGCIGLTNIAMGESIDSITTGMYSGCTGLETVEVPISITSIGDYAFQNCTRLKSISIQNSVTSIGANSFAGCKALEAIIVPNSIKVIEPSSFAYCDNLNQVEIPSSVTEIRNRAFYRCKNLSRLSLPNSIISIGESAFSGCGLTNISLSNSLGAISNSAFAYCRSLTSIYIPNSVKEIASYAFQDCVNLKSVTIGNSVKSIEGKSFSGCTILSEINSLNSVPPICSGKDGGPFDNTHYENTVLKIPEGSLNKYRAADGWSNFRNIQEVDFSSVDNIDKDNIYITIENGNIAIKGAYQNVIIEVYNASGQLVYRGMDTTINVPAKGIYIVKVAGQTFKVII